MRKIKVSHLSLIEAFFSSLVVGLAETYFPAFSILKGASSIQAGILVSVPMIFAILFQWVLLKQFKNLKLSTWVPLAAGVQLISLFGLTIVASMNLAWPVTWLFILYSIYWAGFYSSIPAWNRWISDLISVDESQKYFSARTRYTQFGILLGLFIGGFLLHFKTLKFENINFTAESLFALLFAVCAVFKFITFKLFQSHTQSLQSIQFDSKKVYDLIHFFKPFFKRYTVFNFTVFFSAPFVASYLLIVKQLDYTDFMWVMFGLFAGKISMTLFLSSHKKSIPAVKLLFYGAILSAPLPIFWIFCKNVPMMFGLHFVSGIAWACWEVGLSLSFFKNIKSDEKIEFISVFTSLNVLTQVLGTAVGALLLKFIFQTNYEVLFVFAGVLRLITAWGLKAQLNLLTQAKTN